MSHNWYIFAVIANQENSIKNKIDTLVQNNNWGDLVQEILIPVVKVNQIAKDGVKQVEKRLFPGNLFINMALFDEGGNLNSDLWYAINSVNGVFGAAGVKRGQIPLPVPAFQMKEVMDAIAEGQQVSKVVFNVNDAVIIKDGGAFNDQEGTVLEVDNEAGRVRVGFDMFGRTNSLDLPFYQVQPASEEQK